MTELPDIIINPGQDLCTFHPLPWKETWTEPKTIATVIKFMMHLFDTLMADEWFQELCGADIKKVTPNMPRPLCCWVAVHYPEKLEEAYKSVNVSPPDAREIASNN